MNTRPVIDEATVPALPRHVKLRFNEQRGQWVMQAPERLLVPDETAVEILKLCDGKQTVARIVDELAGRYKAPREQISKDVAEMLQGLADQGYVVA